MPESLNRTLGGAALLAVSVGSAGIAWHLLGTQRREEKVKPACDWSEQRVLKWLRNVGVTKETVSTFQSERINGNVLRSLTDQDIQLLSATSRDSEMICGALRDADELSSMGELLKQTQSLFSQLAANRVASKEERIHELQSILYALKSFQRLPSGQQASALLKMSKQVSALLAVNECVEAEARCGDSVVERDGGGDSRKNAEMESDSVEGVFRMVNQIDEMLDSFLVCGRDAGKLPREQFLEVRERILKQVDKATEIVSLIPGGLGGEILEKCRVIRLLFEADSRRVVGVA